MGFFTRFKNALARFMYGRNGADQLSMTLLWAAILLDLLLPRLIKNDKVTSLTGLVAAGIAVVALWRMLSKNLQKRRAENAKYLQKFWWPVRRTLQGKKQQLSDKEHKYFTCSGCGTVCRVPKGKGKIVITCPKCGQKIQGKS